MLLIGNNIELLSSFVLNFTGIKTIIATKEPPEVISHKLASASTNISVVILDVDQLHQDISKGLSVLKSNFPNARIFALYHTSSAELKGQLLKMGFDNVLTLDDDLHSKITEDSPK